MNRRSFLSSIFAAPLALCGISPQPRHVFRFYAPNGSPVTIAALVKWADNTKELQRNREKGLKLIEAVQERAEKWRDA